ncbi:hypothetical protein [Phenylobacterium sp.]|uniref:hypothetical protein n=1 Tax=Phenylobacterium sp. TaxID=1871053 RepID=UPI002736DA07|nr:hypothetical protein [Phenylobacterium sp.]MDP3853428.1 hypothetical protein [Phenylobacterium sp.]
MKKILLSMAAVAALTAAAPAAAQNYGGYDRGDRYEDRGDRYDRDDRYDRYDRYDRGNVAGPRVERLMAHIARAERNGQVSRGTAQWLRQQVVATQRLAMRYSRDGFSGWERRDIDERYNRLARRLGQDDPRYGYGYGDDYRR